jgi:hypothetical protein
MTFWEGLKEEVITPIVICMVVFGIFMTGFVLGYVSK